MCHATLHDGSEQDLWIHYGAERESTILIELRHHYIDQHLVLFHLWRSDRGRDRTYPVELFLDSDVITESLSNGRKALEFFVRPVALVIRVRNLDVSKHLPGDEALARSSELIAAYPIFRLWRLFEKEEFAGASTVAKEILQSSALTKGIAGAFWRSVAGICTYCAGDFLEAAEHFLQSGAEYMRSGLIANANVSLFFAMEAGRHVDDMNKSLEIACRVVDGFSLDQNPAAGAYKQQLVNIVKSFYTHSGDYVGPTVQCRRVVELYLSRLLEARFATPIKRQVEAAKRAGDIPKNAGNGCNAVVLLAAAKGLITEGERNVALHIKDFGNKIHDDAGVGSSVDAKYALQSCLHLLRRQIR